VENKLAVSLIVSLDKALNGLPLALSGYNKTDIASGSLTRRPKGPFTAS